MYPVVTGYVPMGRFAFTQYTLRCIRRDWRNRKVYIAQLVDKWVRG